MSNISAFTLSTENLKAILSEWFIMKKKLGELKAAESNLRKDLFGFMFKAPVEGTNKYDLQDGHEVRATHVIDRKVETAFKKEMEERAERTRTGQQTNDQLTPEELAVWDTIPFEKLIRWKPELSVSEYRKLTPAQVHLFDQILTVKDGSPQMEVKPASRRQAQ